MAPGNIDEERAPLGHGEIQTSMERKALRERELGTASKQVSSSLAQCNHWCSLA